MSFGFFTFSENSLSSLASSATATLSGVSATFSVGTMVISGSAVVALSTGLAGTTSLGDESIILSPVI